MLPLHRPKLKHNINLRDTSTDWTRYCTELRAYDQNLEFQTREGKQGNKNENNKKYDKDSGACRNAETHFSKLIAGGSATSTMSTNRISPRANDSIKPLRGGSPSLSPRKPPHVLLRNLCD